jgi:hypothetical protein
VLSAAARWQALVTAFGEGILGLIPEQCVSNDYIERKLTKPKFAVFVQAIDRFNPQVKETSKAWCADF